ncbi:hypothetical protein LIER_17648 [Lithospermum erythrorhizon]|uniref:Retrotransposon Copia-like N-terminal domain-containing protein n=1 Tax=Lithospermum erythrorhizon TaxID=34254 RepID=A0AAV3QF82_LITER
MTRSRRRSSFLQLWRHHLPPLFHHFRRTFFIQISQFFFNFPSHHSNSDANNFNSTSNLKNPFNLRKNSLAPVIEFLNSDPLQLHHSDHPNYVLSKRLLNPNNYYKWRRSVEISLLAKNKLGFVNGDIPRPHEPIAAA